MRLFAGDFAFLLNLLKQTSILDRTIYFQVYRLFGEIARFSLLGFLFVHQSIVGLFISSGVCVKVSNPTPTPYIDVMLPSPSK